jgi:hypothetical protein
VAAVDARAQAGRADRRDDLGHLGDALERGPRLGLDRQVDPAGARGDRREAVARASLAAAARSTVAGPSGTVEIEPRATSSGKSSTSSSARSSV